MYLQALLKWELMDLDISGCVINESKITCLIDSYSEEPRRHTVAAGSLSKTE